MPGPISGGGGSAAATPKKAAVVSKSTTQAITTSTETVVTFDTEQRDTDAFHDTGSNTGRLTAPATGWYTVKANVRFAASNAGERYAILKKNGTTQISIYQTTLPPTNIVVGLPLDADVSLTAGDYVELIVWHSRGSNLDIAGGIDGTTFSMTEI